MFSLVLLALGVLIAYQLSTTLWQLKRNIDAAKASGLPYTVVPVFAWSIPMLVFGAPIVRFLHRIPKKYRPLWMDRLRSLHTWDNLMANHKGNPGLATYLTVSPARCLLWTANAEVICQVSTRRNDFPKPGKMYRAINIYGKNLVTAEGQLWRRHRKITGPPFSEKNNHIVFVEGMRQAKFMLEDWTGKKGDESRLIKTVARDCMRLTLHVISRAGFGVRLQWPGIESSKEAEKLEDLDDLSANRVGPGHTMTYTQALEALLHNVIFIVSLPRNVLRQLPFKLPQLAYEAYTEWGKYMNEMMESKKIALTSGQVDESDMDLMAALVKSAGYGTANSLEKGQAESLSDEEILGNAFVFILAGHETTANTIHFALTYLAMHLDTQRRLQADLDTILDGRNAEDWDYERDFPRLFGGMTGAVMNETLRLIPPAIHIPKLPAEPQSLTIDGKEYTVPADTLVNLCADTVHRNPRYWPTAPPSDPSHPIHPTSNTENDLEEFKPERWLLNPDGNPMTATSTGSSSDPSKPTPLAEDAFPKTADTESLGVNTSADTASSLFKPEKGAYVPFSEGFRSCIGRRFAQVEILAALAVLMSKWSVELGVDEWASPEELERMSENEKRAVWETAREDALRKFRTKMEVTITMKFMGGTCVPVRFVRRGMEKFNF